MNKKTNITIILAFVCLANECLAAVGSNARRSLSEIVATNDFPEESSIWESSPVETSEAQVQILDKVSGRVFRGKIRKNVPIQFNELTLVLKRCFKNSPENPKEIYAFVEIYDGTSMVFANWLFASSPSTNLFSHPMFDVRIEF